MREILVLK